MGDTVSQWRKAIGTYGVPGTKIKSKLREDVREEMANDQLKGESMCVWSIVGQLVLLSVFLGIMLSIASKGIHKEEDEVLKSQCKQMAKMELLGNKLVEDGITGAFSLCKRILLIIAGEEQNPGPITTFQTKLDKCLICKSGEIVITKRSVEKENNFIIYGRNGEREGTHLEGRCNFKNGYFTCNAGYFYGYMT